MKGIFSPKLIWEEQNKSSSPLCSFCMTTLLVNTYCAIQCAHSRSAIFKSSYNCRLCFINRTLCILFIQTHQPKKRQTKQKQKQKKKKNEIVYLNSVLCKVGFQRKHFARVNIRIMSIFKCLLKLFELVTGEYRSENKKSIIKKMVNNNIINWGIFVHFHSNGQESETKYWPGWWALERKYINFIDI